MRLAALDVRQGRDRRRPRRLGRVQRQPQPVRRRRLACGTLRSCSSAKTRARSSGCTGTCCAASARTWAARRTKRSPASSSRCGTSRPKPSACPVYELFGGPMRDSMQLYWSHCGTTRARHGELARPAAAAHLRRHRRPGTRSRRARLHARSRRTSSFPASRRRTYFPASAADRRSHRRRGDRSRSSSGSRSSSPRSAQGVGPTSRSRWT